MTDEGIAEARRLFLAKYPDFGSFEHAPEQFISDEIVYKRQAAEQVGGLMSGFVQGRESLATDAVAKELAGRAFDLTNFLNWRDRQYIDELLGESGQWVAFMNRMLACLKGTEDGSWAGQLEGLLLWLANLKCAANITKVLPSYFLFFWEPKTHVFIKPRSLDRFLEVVGAEKTGTGSPLTLDKYKSVLATFSQIKEALADWAPRDNIDLHSFAWVVAGASNVAPPARKPDAVPLRTVETVSPGKPVLPQRPGLPLNLILAGPPGTGKTHKLLTEYVQLFEEAGQQQSSEEYIKEKCSELTWQEVCVVALALLEKPARVPEIAKTGPVLAKKAALGRTTKVMPTLWSVLQLNSDEKCPNIQVALRVAPGLFWKEQDSSWRLSDEAPTSRR